MHQTQTKYLCMCTKWYGVHLSVYTQDEEVMLMTGRLHVSTERLGSVKEKVDSINDRGKELFCSLPVYTLSTWNSNVVTV